MPYVLLPLIILSLLSSGCAHWKTDVETYDQRESSDRLGSASAIFVGHAYGIHGSTDIPYPPLANFFAQNNIPKDIFFLGDMVERQKNLGDFINYLKDIPGKNFIFIRGNHDGDEFYRYFPSYQEGTTGGHCWVWRDMTVTQVVTAEHVRDMLRCSGKTLVLSHFGFWQEHIDTKFERVLNSSYKAKDSFKQHLKTIKDKELIFVSGDGGAFFHSAGFYRKVIGKHEFYVGGMGGGKGVDHVIAWSPDRGMSPVFFDHRGAIIGHRCFARRGELRCDARTSSGFAD